MHCQLALVTVMVAGFAIPQVTGSCDRVKIKPGSCAALFENKDCTGKNYTVPFGAGNLPRGILGLGNQRDIHSSVVVRGGSSFRGYDVAANATDPKSKVKPAARKSNFQLVTDLGRKVVVNGDNSRDKKFNFKRLDDKISFVACTDDNEGKCPAVPEFLCAICYDEKDCVEGDWSPLDIPIAKKLSLPGNGPRNGIESCSVRRGCSINLIDNDFPPFNDGNITVSATTRKDLHFNLNGNRDKKIDALSNDAEEVICTCGSSRLPTFSKGI